MSTRRSAKPRKGPAWSPKATVILVMAIGIFGLALGLGAWLYHRAKPTRPAYTGPVQHLSTGLIGEYATLILIAQDQGYFKANGLDVTIKEYPSGPAALTDLLAGKLDTAMASDFAGVRNSFAGQDLKILANLSRSEAFDIVARRDHGIAIPAAGLKGKTIGVTQGTVGEFYLGQFLSFNRLSLHDITLVNLTQQEQVDALRTGRIDAAVLFEPNAYNAKTQLGANAVSWSAQSGQSIYSLLYSTSRLTSRQPDAIRRYLQAIVQAEQFVRAHDGQARTIIAHRLRYSPGYIDYIWPKFSFAATLDQELLLNMDDEARWLIENHLVPGPKPPNYLNWIYLSGLEAVKPEGITIIH